MQGTEVAKGTFTANGALGRNVRVKVTSASATLPIQVEVAGANDPAIGVTEYAAADGETVVVAFYGGRSMHMTAAAVLAAGAAVYGAAAGKVQGTGAARTIIGVAAEAATAVDDIIVVIPYGAEVAQ